MIAGGMESFAALMMMGVRVRETTDLDERVMWLPRQMLLLIDGALTCRERRSVADQLFTEVAALPHPQYE
jgi:hypothetical protein